jgi:hypothetical protein
MVNLPGVTLEEFRDKLLNLVNELERLKTELLAQKAILEMEVPPEHDWQTQVQELIHAMQSGNYPQFQALHQQFDDMRQQIQQATEDHQLVELFQQFPPTGEPN